MTATAIAAAAPATAATAPATVVGGNRYFELLDEGRKDGLLRLRAIDVYAIKPGSLGGLVASEHNLDATNGAWIAEDASAYEGAVVCGAARVSGRAQVFGRAVIDGNAAVYGDARVFGNARVSDFARICERASVSGNAHVFGHARVYGDAYIAGSARLFGEARAYGNAMVVGNARVVGMLPTVNRSDGHSMTLFWTPDGACVASDGECLSLRKARLDFQKTRGGTVLGEEILAILDYFESVAPLLEREATAFAP